MPAVRLDRVGGFRIEREIEPVTDEEVTKILDGIRNEHGDWTPVERKPVEGERVTVVIEPLASPEDQPTGEASPYQFVLGSGEALEDVERAIRELTSGGSGVFEVSFGTDEEADAEADTRHLHIRLDQVEERLLPDLDDDLATKVGDFENLAALESAVREDLAKHHAEESEATVRGQLMQAVIEANPFALPAALVDRYLDELIQAPDDADPGKVREARSELVPLAERQIKEQMILDHLIEREGLKASTEEVEAEIGRLAERRNIQPQEVRRRLVREGALHTVERNLAADKVFEYLKGESGVA
jgi:trigger factor